eukprot:3565677-Pleurochrysis_carterae.AAC.2
MARFEQNCISLTTQCTIRPHIISKGRTGRRAAPRLRARHRLISQAKRSPPRHILACSYREAVRQCCLCDIE